MKLLPQSIVLSLIVASGVVGQDVFFYEGDQNVVDLKRPSELTDVLKKVEAGEQPSVLIEFYSATCPHCQNFKSTWKKVGENLQCKNNSKIYAFECPSDPAERADNASSMKGILPADSENPEVKVSPWDICILLGIHLFPTISILSRAELPLDDHWVQEPMNLRVNVTSYELAMLGHIPATHILDSVIDSGLFAECNDNRIRADEIDKIAVSYLEEKDKTQKMEGVTSAAQPGRWSEDALIMDPDSRLHDSVRGVYDILLGWIFLDNSSLNETQVAVVKNFLLLVGTSLPDFVSKKQIFNLMNKLDTNTTRLSWAPSILELNLCSIPVFDQHDQKCSTKSCLIWTLMHTAAQIQLQRVKFQKPEFLPLFDVSGENEKGDEKKEIEQTGNTQVRRNQVVDVEDKTKLMSYILSAEDFSTAFQDFIENFFTCTPCRSHFHEGYTMKKELRQQWTHQGAPGLGAMKLKPVEAEWTGMNLWLWRFHDVVTVRTATERSADELRNDIDQNSIMTNERNVAKMDFQLKYDNVDVRFPGSNKTLCASCGTEAGKSFVHGEIAQFIEKGEEKINFDHVEDSNLTSIADFLTKYYFNPVS